MQISVHIGLTETELGKIVKNLVSYSTENNKKKSFNCPMILRKVKHNKNYHAEMLVS